MMIVNNLCIFLAPLSTFTVFDHADHMIQRIYFSLHSEEDILSGDIMIGCGETYVMELFAALFAQMHAQYPQVRFHTHSGDADTVLERLDKGLVDLGLLVGPIRQEKYDYLDLRLKDTFGLLIPKNCPLAAQTAISIEQLKTLPLILAEQTFSGHQELEWFGVDQAALHIAATYNPIYNATFMVEKCLGYALCLDKLVATQGRDLTFRPITPELSVDLYLVTKKYQTFSPTVKAFLSLLQAHLAPADWPITKRPQETVSTASCGLFAISLPRLPTFAARFAILGP